MRRFVSSLLAGLAMVAAPAPAFALTIAGAYYEDTAQAVCNSSLSCTMYFAEFPASLQGQFVTITQVSCATNVSADGQTLGLVRAEIHITDAKLNPRRHMPIAVERAAGVATFVNNIELKVSGGPPRQVALVLYSRGPAPSVFSGRCVIVGHISST